MVLVVIVRGRGDHDNVRVGVGGGLVRGGADVQLALSAAHFAEKAPDLVVLDRADEAIQPLGLFRRRCDGGDLMVLREQHRERKPDIADARHRDPAGRTSGDRGRVGVDKKLHGIKMQRLRQRVELVGGGGELPGLQPRDESTVDAGQPGQCGLRQTQFPAPGCDNAGKELRRELFHIRTNSNSRKDGLLSTTDHILLPVTYKVKDDHKTQHHSSPHCNNVINKHILRRRGCALPTADGGNSRKYSAR